MIAGYLAAMRLLDPAAAAATQRRGMISPWKMTCATPGSA
jgi:hypothetical protein